MRLSNSERMYFADRTAISERGIPSIQLMETAAHAVANAAMDARRSDSAAIFCGSGNNGGDGIAAARFLLEQGIKVRVFLTGKWESMTPDSLEMERRLRSVGGYTENFEVTDEVRDYVSSCGVIIDAMFGIGLNKPIRGSALEAIELINSSKAPAVAVDIASGVEADTGRVLGSAVKADVTVTFSFAKPGQFSDPGGVYSGKVIVADIGIPEDVLAQSVTHVHAVMPGELTLPRRREISHKGDYGKILIVGGAPGYTGAPTMCAKAAVRSGAGLVWLGVPKEIYGVTAVKNDEVMPFAIAGLDDLLERAEKCDVVAVGPGMGKSPEAQELCLGLIRGCQKPMVIDADGLNALATDISAISDRKAPTVLTPHDVEFMRLGGELTGDRVGDAARFAVEHKCVLVLKGHRTVIAFPDGESYISTTGNAGMAKGGSGDVLTGIIAAMLGQLKPRRAICTGVYLHGLAGDMCRDELGEYAMTPTDMINSLAKATRKMMAQE